MNKRNIVFHRTGALLLCFLLLCVSFSGVYAEETEEGQSRYYFQSQLNILRSTLGLKTAMLSEELVRAGSFHASYMKDASSLSMTEESSRPLFHAMTPQDRARCEGYRRGGIIELNFRGEVSGSSLLENALKDPQKRYYLLNPSVCDFGLGRDGDYSCLMLGCRQTSENDRLLIYPYPGAQSIGNTRLSLLTSVPQEVSEKVSRGQIGEIISVSYYHRSKKPVEFRKIVFTLTDTKHGNVLDCFLHQACLGNQTDTLLIYPLSSYTTDTRYTAALSCEIWQDGRLLETVDTSWSYTSSGPDSIGEISRLEALVLLGQVFGIEPDPKEITTFFRFQDYPYDPSDPASLLIYSLIQDNILSHQQDGLFLLPADGITRQQLAFWTMAFLKNHDPMLYYSVPLHYHDTFEDINSCQEKMRSAVQKTKLLGIASDQGGNRFSPQVYTTRTELDEWFSRLRILLETRTVSVS